MDLNHLRYFVAIAKKGSMSSAARSLRVSQPTLTVAVRNLEEALNTTLFLRDSKGVSLTESGQVLLESTDEIFALVERTEQSIRGLENEAVGQFLLGSYESLGAYFLPRFMKRFQEDAPRVELQLWNGSSPQVREAVINRTIHFGLVVNPMSHPDLVMTELFADAMEVLVNAEEPRALTLEEAKERIQRGPLIMTGRVPQCQDLLSRFVAGGYAPSRTLSCGDLELVKSLVLEGVGVALLPRRVGAYGHPKKLRRLHPELPSFPDSIHLLYRGDLHRTKAALILKDALVEYGRSLPTIDALE